MDDDNTQATEMTGDASETGETPGQPTTEEPQEEPGIEETPSDSEDSEEASEESASSKEVTEEASEETVSSEEVTEEEKVSSEEPGIEETPSDSEDSEETNEETVSTEEEAEEEKVSTEEPQEESGIEETPPDSEDSEEASEETVSSEVVTEEVVESSQPEPSYGDQELDCQQCSEKFLFTEREQRFFLEMGFVNPRYCPACRKARKQQENRKNVEWKDNYDVVCDRCEKATTVPFKPVNGRPVYCRECLTEIRKDKQETQHHYFNKRSSAGAGDSINHNEISGVGLTRIEDSERPYGELDENVSRLLGDLFDNQK